MVLKRGLLAESASFRQLLGAPSVPGEGIGNFIIRKLSYHRDYRIIEGLLYLSEMRLDLTVSL